MNTLMERPSDDVLKYKAKKLFYGKEMEDYVTNSIYDDWCRFHSVQMDVKEKIEKDKLYKVWFEYHDASDPMDSSCSYRIYYIEEVPIEIENALNSWKKCEKIVKDYLLI
jgi:hypothetical protein